MFHFDNVSTSSTVLTIQNCMHTCIHVHLSTIVALSFLCSYVLPTCLPVCVCSVYNVLSSCQSVFKSCLPIVCMMSGLLVCLYDVLPSFAFVRRYAYLSGCLVSWPSSPFIGSVQHSMSYHCLLFKTVTYGDCSALWHYRLITGPSHMINVYWCINVILRHYFNIPENNVSEVLSTRMYLHL
jgi:hypothetical protein